MLDATAAASITRTLAEVRSRQREYARAPTEPPPPSPSIKRSEFDAVRQAAIDILTDPNGRLAVDAIADRLHWRSHGRVRTIIHTLRAAHAWRWTLQTTEEQHAG